MQRTLLILALGAISTLGCGHVAIESDDYTATMVMLPVGDPDAGRQAFLSLGCTTCHTVAWDTELPAPVSATSGPELGLDVAKPGLGGLATSIVAPSHHVSEKYGASGDGGRSPMVDYTATMTIRQLADIVAYLERQGLVTHTRTGQSAPG